MKTNYDLSKLFAGQEPHNIKKKTVVCDSSMGVDGLYLISSGRMKVTVLSANGQDEYTLNTIGPGDPFPLPIYFNMQQPKLRYTAETNVKAAWRPRAEVDEYFHAHPVVMYQIMKLVLTVLYARINTLSRGSAEEKVLRRLIEFSVRFGDPCEDKFEITITQQELADSVGLSRESVNLMLNRLEEKSVLTTSRNKIYLSISRANAEIAAIVSA